MHGFHLNRILNISALIFLSVLLIPSYAKDMYKWVDKDGTSHVTDDPAKIPEEKKGEVTVIEGESEGSGEETEVDITKIAPAPSEEESSESDLEKEREEAIREEWRSRALEIEDKKNAILEEIESTKQALREKKREVDSLLINGYFADYSILELRYLSDYLKELEDQLEFIKQEKANLEEEARREGIPPGYLRP
jgi:Domain of unknown function (DUF4124)